MINKIKKLITTIKFNHNQNKRFAQVLDQNIIFENESSSKIFVASVCVGIIAAACFWMIAISLDAQASRLDKKLEQQEFYNIIRSTYNQ